MSVIAATSFAGDAEAAKRKKKSTKKARPPAAATQTPEPPKPAEVPPEPAPAAVAPNPAAAPASTVESGSPQKRSVVIIVEGTNGRDLDNALKKTFGKQVTIATPTQVREAVSANDQRIFNRPKKKSDLTKAMKRVAKKAGVDGVIYANVGGNAKAGYQAAVIVVYRTGKVGVDGTVPVSKTTTRGKRTSLKWHLENVATLVQPGIDGLADLPTKGAKEVPIEESQDDSSSLSDAIAGFEATRGDAAEEGTLPDAEVTATARTHESDMFERRMSSPIMVKLGMEAGHRTFGYNQPLTSNLRDYTVGVAPLVTIEGEAYPFANTSVPVLKNIGWYGQYSRAFGVQSSFRSATDGDNVRVNNVWNTWQVGLHSRFKVGERFGLGGQATYGFSAYRFEFTDIADERSLEVPDVRYNFLRVGAEGRMPIAFLDLNIGAGYRTVLSGGRVASSYFPNSSAGAVDGYATMGLPISRSFSLDGTLRYTRYFYDLKPEPGDTYVAGGALDQYFMASLSIVYMLEGHD